MKRSIVPLCLLLALLTSNWVLWTKKKLILYSDRVTPTAPALPVPLGRTADDIARGLLAMEEVDLSSLRPLLEEGLRLRREISNLQGQHVDLELQLLKEGTDVLEMRQ